MKLKKNQNKCNNSEINNNRIATAIKNRRKHDECFAKEI